MLRKRNAKGVSLGQPLVYLHTRRITPCTHSLEYVGIDTCSALSVSTEASDFIFIDDSPEATQSVSLRGIGGEQNIVGGRGPLVICTQDENHSRLYRGDPSGVYLAGQGIIVAAENPRSTKNEEVRFRFGSK